MNMLSRLNRNYEAIAWGALFIWWGITGLVKTFPNGTGAIGIGVILLGVNGARYLNGVAVSGFSTILGILALLWGVLELLGSVIALPFELPIFPIMLITLGLLLLVGEIFRSNKQE